MPPGDRLIGDRRMCCRSRPVPVTSTTPSSAPISGRAIARLLPHEHPDRRHGKRTALQGMAKPGKWQAAAAELGLREGAREAAPRRGEADDRSAERRLASVLSQNRCRRTLARFVSEFDVLRALYADDDKRQAAQPARFRRPSPSRPRSPRWRSRCCARPSPAAIRVSWSTNFRRPIPSRPRSSWLLRGEGAEDERPTARKLRRAAASGGRPSRRCYRFRGR